MDKLRKTYCTTSLISMFGLHFRDIVIAVNLYVG